LCLLVLQQFAFCQSNQDFQFLSKIGIGDSIYSKVLEESRQFYVQLPEDYDREDTKKYPVVYILDGDVLLPTLSIVQDYYSGGFTPEMILVGISNAENRTRDLTTSKDEQPIRIQSTTQNGEGNNFVRFIQEELIPIVESKYRVTSYRTLIGHSYGGLFAMHVLIHYPDLFDNYIAIDPSLDWDNRQLLSEAKEILPFVDYSNKSLFISLNGQLHMQKPEMTIANVMKDSTDFTSFSRANLAFSDLIKEHADNGLAYEWKFYPRDLHGTIPFPSMMDGLISVFEWFQMEDVHKFNNPESTINELRSLMQYRANKLEEHFGNVVPPYPDFLLNVLGYMSMDIGQMAKAKMFFEFVIEFYPDSANAYDSMADYYERNGDFVSALANIQKAYNIKQEDYYKERIEMLKKK
jgi:predicted alpha/beta superfamily hydrolase/uncharacterized protein YozE (UPF0346 family)